MGNIFRGLALIGVPALLTVAANASVIVNASVSAGGAGGTCEADAHYSYSTGASGSTPTIACGWSVNPSSPGATAVALQASQLGGSSASESFDLSNGVLRAGIDSVPGFGGGSTFATLRDTVTFTNNNSSSALLGVIWRVDGRVALDTASPGSCCFGITYQGVLGGSVHFNFGEDVNNGITSNSLTTTGYDSSGSTGPTPGDVGGTVNATFQLAPGQTSLPFEMDLNMSGGYGSADFGHTFQISLDVPQGVTFTSESGAFLTAATPEPSTWLPLLAAIAGFLFWRARRPVTH